MTQIYDSWKLKFTENINTIRYEKYIPSVQELLNSVHLSDISYKELMIFLEKFYSIRDISSIVYAYTPETISSKIVSNPKNIDSEIFLCSKTNIYGYSLYSSDYKIYNYIDDIDLINNLLDKNLSNKNKVIISDIININNAYIYVNNTYTSIYFSNNGNLKLKAIKESFYYLVCSFINKSDFDKICIEYENYTLTHLGFTFFNIETKLYELKISILKFN